MKLSLTKRLVALLSLIMLLASAFPVISQAYPYYQADSKSGCKDVYKARQCMAVWVTWKVTGPDDYQIIAPTRVKGSLRSEIVYPMRDMFMYLYVYSDYGRQSVQWAEELGYIHGMRWTTVSKYFDSRLPSYGWYWNRAGYDLAVFYAAEYSSVLLWNLSIGLP